MTKKTYEFEVYDIGTLNFQGYPDLTKIIFFDKYGNKECRFMQTGYGVGIVIDGILAWAIGTREGISIDKKICFYKKKNNFYLGFRVEDDNNS